MTFISPCSLEVFSLAFWPTRNQYIACRGVTKALQVFGRTGSELGGIFGTCMMSSKALLASSWTTVAKGYEDVLVHRFRPWTNDALDKLEKTLDDHTRLLIQSPHQDDRSALVLCCGPGQELLPLAKMIPSCKVLGTDLASGMVNRAKRRIERECQREENSKYKDLITVEVGDAADLPKVCTM